MPSKLPSRPKGRGIHLENLARLRQLAYRLLSSVLLYPEEGRSKNLIAAAELLERRHSMVEFAFFPQWQRFLACLADLSDCRALEQEYVRVFMRNPERRPCQPYESAYVDPLGQATGWLLTLLEQEYAAAGLGLSPFIKDSPDHVSVELEFMAFLCGQEVDAWEHGAVGDGLQALERQAAFLGRHLIRWISDWTRDVATIDEEGIYSVAAEAVRAFISHDRDLIDVLLDRFGERSGAAQSGGVSKLAGEGQQHRGSFSHAP